MPKIKEVDLKNVGGRIRKARTDASLTIKELSEKIGVSFAYLGMVERGERNPSDKLLACIAEATDTPLDWLETTPVTAVSGSANTPTPGSLSSLPASINIPIFLSLVVQFVPNMTKDKLSATLGISMEALEDILSGKSQALDASSTDFFPALARQMDISSVSQKLRDIDLFLQNESFEKKKKTLHESLKRFAGSKYQYFKHFPEHSVGFNNSLGPETIYAEHIVLQESESPKSEAWHFVFYQFCDSIEEALSNRDDTSLTEDDEGIVSEILANYLDGVPDGKFTHIFESEKIIRHVEAYITMLYDSDDDYKDGMAPRISLLQVDKQTWEVVGDLLDYDSPFYDGTYNEP